MGGEKQPEHKKTTWPERGSRFLRDINVVGAVAMAGVAVVAPAVAAPAWALAGLNAGQAAFFEATRRMAARRAAKAQSKSQPQ